MFDELKRWFRACGWSMYHRSLFCERWRNGTTAMKLDYSTGKVEWFYL